MQIPIQIYLDSKDFSRMADREKRTDDQICAKTFDYLISKVRSEEIQIRISVFHVGELLPRSPEYKDAGLRRASTAKALCDKNAFIYYERVVLEDIDFFLKDEKNKQKHPFPEYAFSDDGNWAPYLGASDFNVLNTIRKMLTDEISKAPLDSRSRRNLIGSIIKPNGTFTKRGISILQSDRHALLNALNGQFPLTRKFWVEDYFIKVVSGEIEERVFVKELISGLCDLENLAGWIYDRYEDTHGLTSVLFNAGTKFISSIADARNKIDNIISQGLNAGLSEEEVIQMCRKSLKKFSVRDRILEIFLEREKKRFYKFGGPSKSSEKVLGSEHGHMPFIDSVCDSMFGFAVDRALQIKNKSKLSESDYADGMHAGYIPYVDIFSCDKRTANFVRLPAKRHGVTVVSRFEDIMPSIDERLKNPQPRIMR
ncbi:hypothetical protein JHL17_28780 [Azospirillum sp. YIM B02556]|uniref:DUF4435 domain-containing protein n=1 Tax=Azospirillum endophyticum TaxID=2800326 RepID=A0ABS1FD87_9PROT|nr:hypothetical protein [Azospirillum endophyticum]MBK1841402.1 hypothetical protein [Azospirillum endophyticum]